jgi:hypothetical protein
MGHDDDLEGQRGIGSVRAGLDLTQSFSTETVFMIEQIFSTQAKTTRRARRAARMGVCRGTWAARR